MNRRLVPSIRRKPRLLGVNARTVERQRGGKRSNPTRGGTRDLFGGCEEFQREGERSEEEAQGHEGPLVGTDARRKQRASIGQGEEHGNTSRVRSATVKTEEGAGKTKRPATAHIAEDNAVPHRYSHFLALEDHANFTRAARITSVRRNLPSAETSVGTSPQGLSMP